MLFVKWATWVAYPLSRLPGLAHRRQVNLKEVVNSWIPVTSEDRVGLVRKPDPENVWRGHRSLACFLPTLIQGNACGPWLLDHLHTFSRRLLGAPSHAVYPLRLWKSSPNKQPWNLIWWVIGSYVLAFFFFFFYHSTPAAEDQTHHAMYCVVYRAVSRGREGGHFGREPDQSPSPACTS